MNESMNFGNLGFSAVTEEKVDNTPAFAKSEEVKTESPEGNTETQVQDTPDEKVNLEEMKKKDAEAASDFEHSSGNLKNYEEDAANFQSIDFGPMQKYLDDDDITDISYSNGGQLWLKSLSKGVYRADQQEVNDALMEKIAFQCSNIMGKTFNMAHPFLDSESAELRMNFVHNSIARNGIAVVFRKTPAKIRLEKQKLLNEKYVRLNIHDFLINCVHAHCNIIVCGETGSGKTELVKYLASHTAENEKLISIEDTLELHLDRIYPTRDIVAMKTNNIASYSDVLVTCMRQNPIWILLSEVRSAEAVTAVRNSISSGHYILSTIHADKAESIPHRMYSLLESNIDVEQFLKTIYRYVQIGVFVRGRYKPEVGRFVREIAGVCEFHVTDDEKAEFTNIYLKNVQGEETFTQPSKYFLRFMEGAGIDLKNLFGENKANVTDGMDMSQIKSPTMTLDDNNDNNENKENKVEQNNEPAPTEMKVEIPNEEKVEDNKTEVASKEETPQTQEVVNTEENKVNVQEGSQVQTPTIGIETSNSETVEQVAPVQNTTNVQDTATVPVSLETPQAVQEQPSISAPQEVPKQTSVPLVQNVGETTESVQPNNVVTQDIPVQGVETNGVQQGEAKPNETEHQSLMEIANQNSSTPPQNETPDVNVTVQEAIPEEPVQEVKAAAPDDIVAKPLIDIFALQNNQQVPEQAQSVPLTNQAEVQIANQLVNLDNTNLNVNNQNISEGNQGVNPQNVNVPVQAPNQNIGVETVTSDVQANVVQDVQTQQVPQLQPQVTNNNQMIQPNVQNIGQNIQNEVMETNQMVNQQVNSIPAVQPQMVQQAAQAFPQGPQVQEQIGQMPAIPQTPPGAVDMGVLNNPLQPNIMTNNAQNMNLQQNNLQANQNNANQMGIQMPTNNQNLSVNANSALGFMNNNFNQNIQPMGGSLAPNPMGMNQPGNQFFM